jgi:hypothetical protein
VFSRNVSASSASAFATGGGHRVPSATSSKLDSCGILHESKVEFLLTTIPQQHFLCGRYIQKAVMNANMQYFF